EALQDHAEHQGRLLHGELAADTGALPVAERLVGVRGPRPLGVAAEVVRVEDLRALAPHRLVAMEHGDEDEDLAALLQPVQAAEARVPVRAEPEDGPGGP